MTILAAAVLATPDAEPLADRPISTAASVAQSKIFQFENRAWVNLHHFLYVLGRATAGTPDAKRAAVASAPQDAATAPLDDDERRIWDGAIAHYIAGLSTLDLVFDDAAIAATNAIARTDDASALTAAGVPADTRRALNAAMRVYRKHWWPAHADANRRRIAAFDQLVARHGPGLVDRLTRLYGEAWPAAGVRVQIAAYANWAGAYSTRGPLLVVASLPLAHDGTPGLEILFHEAMHQWDDQMEARLRRAAIRAGTGSSSAAGTRTGTALSVPDDLSHAMIFYTAGHVTRAVVGDAHTPYAETSGIWQRGLGRFHAALDAHWKPYLDGAVRMDDALVNLLRELGKK